jgi:hypothetical protein
LQASAGRRRGDRPACSTKRARLRATDPTREKRRLSGSQRSSLCCQRILPVSRVVLGDPAIPRRATRSSPEEAAELASSSSFDREPLRGVGTDAWRNLWEAARQFVAQASRTPVSPGGLGPGAALPTGLDEQASQRMSRFEAFVRDVTQRERARAAAEMVLQARKKIEDFGAQPAPVLRALEDLAEAHAEVAATIALRSRDTKLGETRFSTLSEPQNGRIRCLIRPRTRVRRQCTSSGG